MNEASTLTEIVQTSRHMSRSISYVDGEESWRAVSFGEIHERALGLLYHFERRGAQRGDTLILYVSGNESFIEAFWGAVLGGIIPVPVSVGVSDAHRMKLLRIARTLGNPFLYTDRRSLERVGDLASRSGEDRTFEMLRSRTLLTDDAVDRGRSGVPVAARPDDIALIQFSSGSTSEPKGVVLSHANIVANWRAITTATGIDENDISLSWMPLTHDMGLIGFHLVMLANGVETYLMPTDLFVRRPLLWLAVASRIGASLLSSPNFGYRHYLNALADRPVDALDLSAVRLIFNGAEPISAGLCDEFLTRLAPAKLARTAMFPVYGLAEASLAVAFPAPNVAIRAVTLDRRRMRVGSAVVPVAKADPNAIEVVSEGRPVAHCRVRVVGDNDEPLSDGRIGHVHIAGANVARGYYGKPEADAQAITPDGWLRTGDLGFIHDGELHVSGRANEIIVVDGQSFHPHDLEAIVHRSGAVKPGRVVAAGVRPRRAHTDRLVIFVIHRRSLREFLPVAERVAHVVGDGVAVHVGDVVPVRRIPKTTSGKVQRHLLARRYAAGEFDQDLAGLCSLRDAARGAEGGPRSRIERALHDILATVLEGWHVGVNDNLFAIGTTSLALIQIHEQIERQYPGTVALSELFEFPTLAELALHVERRLAPPDSPGSFI